jgi:hypothetical protein
MKIPRKSAIRLILSEEARAEGNGKFSLLGVFPGERFQVGGETPPVGFEQFAFVLPSLAFVFVITDGEGRVPSKLSVLGPDKKPLFPETEIANGIEIKKGSPAIFLSGLRPFLGPKFGAYTIVLKMGKTAVFKFPFQVEKAPAPKK